MKRRSSLSGGGGKGRTENPGADDEDLEGQPAASVSGSKERYGCSWASCREAADVRDGSEAGDGLTSGDELTTSVSHGKKRSQVSRGKRQKVTHPGVCWEDGSETESEEPDYFSHLSLEVICRILNYLPLTTVLLLERQCRKLRDAVALHLRIRKSLDLCQGSLFGWMPRALTDTALSCLLARCRELTHIYGLHPPALARRRSRTRNQLTVPGVVDALASCQRLQGVEVSSIFLLEAILNYLPNLVILGSFRNRDGGLPFSCSNSLSIPTNAHISSLYLSGVSLPELPRINTLSHLSLRWVRMTGSHPFSSFAAPLLQSFVMAHCSGPENPLRYVPLFTGLAASRSLARLELVRVNYLGGLIQHIVEDCWRLQGFRALQSVTFAACKHALEADLGFLAITAENRLEELKVQPSLTKDSLFSAVSMAGVTFPHFDSITLGYLDPEAHEGRQGFGLLGAAEVTESPAMLTDIGMCSVGQCFPSLKRLAVYNCPHLQLPATWMALQNPVPLYQSLVQLHLRRCHSIRLENFAQFIFHLPSLEVLHLEQMFREPPKGCARVGLSAGTGLGVSSALVQNHHAAGNAAQQNNNNNNNLANNNNNNNNLANNNLANNNVAGNNNNNNNVGNNNNNNNLVNNDNDDVADDDNEANDADLGEDDNDMEHMMVEEDGDNEVQAGVANAPSEDDDDDNGQVVHSDSSTTNGDGYDACQPEALSSRGDNCDCIAVRGGHSDQHSTEWPAEGSSGVATNCEMIPSSSGRSFDKGHSKVTPEGSSTRTEGGAQGREREGKPDRPEVKMEREDTNKPEVCLEAVPAKSCAASRHQDVTGALSGSRPSLPGDDMNVDVNEEDGGIAVSCQAASQEGTVTNKDPQQTLPSFRSGDLPPRKSASGGQEVSGEDTDVDVSGRLCDVDSGEDSREVLVNSSAQDVPESDHTVKTAQREREGWRKSLAKSSESRNSRSNSELTAGDIQSAAHTAGGKSVLDGSGRPNVASSSLAASPLSSSCGEPMEEEEEDVSEALAPSESKGKGLVGQGRSLGRKRRSAVKKSKPVALHHSSPSSTSSSGLPVAPDEAASTPSTASSSPWDSSAGGASLPGFPSVDACAAGSPRSSLQDSHSSSSAPKGSVPGTPEAELEMSVASGSSVHSAAGERCVSSGVPPGDSPTGDAQHKPRLSRAASASITSQGLDTPQRQDTPKGLDTPQGQNTPKRLDTPEGPPWPDSPSASHAWQPNADSQDDEMPCLLIEEDGDSAMLDDGDGCEGTPEDGDASDKACQAVSEEIREATRRAREQSQVSTTHAPRSCLRTSCRLPPQPQSPQHACQHRPQSGNSAAEAAAPSSSASTASASHLATSAASASRATSCNAATSSTATSATTTSNVTTCGASTSRVTMCSAATSNKTMSSAATSNTTMCGAATSNVTPCGASTSNTTMWSVATPKATCSSVTSFGVVTSRVATSGVATSSVAISSVATSSVATSTVATSGVATSSAATSSVATSVATSRVAMSSVATSSVATSSAATFPVATSSVATSSAARSSVATSSVATSGAASVASCSHSAWSCAAGTTASGSIVLRETPQKTKRKAKMSDKSTSTSDPVMEDDHVQVLKLKSKKLTSLTLQVVGITSLIVQDCPRLTSINVSACRVLRRVELVEAPVLRRVSLVQCRKLDEMQVISELTELPECDRLVHLRPMKPVSREQLEWLLFSSSDMECHVCLIYDDCPNPNETLHERTLVSDWLDLLSSLNLHLLETERLPHGLSSDCRQVYTMAGENFDCPSWTLVTDLPWLRLLHASPRYQSKGSSGHCFGDVGRSTVEELLQVLGPQIVSLEDAGVGIFPHCMLVYVSMSDVSGTPQDDYYI